MYKNSPKLLSPLFIASLNALPFEKIMFWKRSISVHCLSLFFKSSRYFSLIIAEVIGSVINSDMCLEEIYSASLALITNAVK